ncbi:MAG: hypothetical protein AAF439_14760, partial [Pseudomonadota bacterium]
NLQQILQELTGGVAGAYYAGISLPVYSGLAPISFANWNQTRPVSGKLNHASKLQRREGRIYFTTDAILPETIGLMRDFLDGGRQELVACGPQKLYLHELTSAALTVEDSIISISGDVSMELDGLLTARDDWPVAVSVRTGHERTLIWAELVALDVANLPSEMVDAVRKRVPRITYTREQVLDEAETALSPDLAASLAARRGALDLAFEDVSPVIVDGDLEVVATISVNENALMGLIGDQIASAPTRGVSAFAELMAPSPAQAQLLDQLKDLTDVIDRELGNGVKAPEIIEQTLSQLADCKTSF